MSDDRYRSDNADRKFLYSRLWRERLRPLALRRQPLCPWCELLGVIKAAEQVDHIVRPRGSRRLQTDPQNWRCLCAGHHQMKSLWERRNDGKPLKIGVGADGWPIVVDPLAPIPQGGSSESK